MTREMAFLEPVQVAAYLRARGWKERKSFCEEKATLWLAPSEKADADVLLPRRANVGDFGLRMDQLVREVAQVEGRSLAEVIADLAFANADVLRVCLSGPEGNRGAVPFRSSVKLLRSLQDVFAAAALAALEKRAIFTNRKVEKVAEFISHLELGHTLQSSFIFTVASPLSATANGERERSEQEEPAGPFERQVTRTLMKALEATKKAAEIAKENGLEAFQSAVKDGVSGNLCDAIAEVTNLSPTHDIELSMTWAASLLQPKDTPDRIAFRKETIPIIEAAGDAFWGMSKEYDTKIEGMISALDINERGAAATATIVGYVGGRAHLVRASFGAEHLGELGRAYEQRLLIKCEGDLIREHGQHVLQNARYFEVVGDRAS